MKPLLLALTAVVLLLGVVSAGSRQAAVHQVTYSGVIKPLMDKKCLTCHVKGGGAPFPLQSYAQVKKRSDLCLRMMLTRTMPPCYATSDFGEFCAGGGPLTDEEAIQLQEWVQSGAPEGEPSQPAPTPDLRAWRLGKPDAVLKPSVSIPVEIEGHPYWRAYTLPLGNLSGRRIRAFDIRVAQPQALRSAVLAVARDGLLGTRRAVNGFTTGGSLDDDAKTYLGTWAMGYPAWELPKGVAMTLNGEALVLQALYMPRGKDEDGSFEVGLYFAKGDRDREAQWLHMGQEEFEVPAPGNLVLEPKGQLPPRSEVIAVYPEARYFCTSIRLWAGDKQLFATRKWEPYWQGVFRYQEPVPLPQGAELRAEFSYDNDIHMGHNEGRRPRPIQAGYRERDELCRLHVLFVRR